MKGYKAFNQDMTCRGYKYEIGKTYHMDGEIVPCKRGFHFCKSIIDCYRFYPIGEKIIICEVESGDVVITDDNIKWVTNELTIIAKVDEQWQRKGNATPSSTGYCNIGEYNTGNYNTGCENVGDYNTGNRNAGYGNAGNCNTGHCNTGYCNIGNYNVGDFNTGDFNTGCFCVNTPYIMMFDVQSNWTMNTWLRSKAYYIMMECPVKHQERQKWWDELPIDDKQAIFKLPNFNADKFCRCVGIEHCSIKEETENDD